MNPAPIPMAMNLGATEIMIILLILVLLFGAKKLPELARGSGRALRIFKAETKGLMDENEGDVDEKYKTPEQKQIEAARRAETGTTDTTVNQPRADEH
jgi:sec-independent protein translocase protein TatA